MSNPRLNLIYNAIMTPDGTVIESTHRHDYRTHEDANGKTYMVDGGLEYSRKSAWGDEVDLRLYNNEPHSVQRSLLTWGTYGKDGNEPLKRIFIEDMETEHIQAVIRECAPSAVLETCMKKELWERGCYD